MTSATGTGCGTAATAGVAAIGIPGAVALGAVGAWVACRRAGIRLGPVAAAAAPAVAFGLAIGGLGNWWEQQFYGQPSAWWWAVQITPEHRVPGYEKLRHVPARVLVPVVWDVALGLVVIWAARRFKLTGERTFLLAAAGYAVGGWWVESLRIGPCRMCLAYATVHSAIWEFSSWRSWACT